MNICPFCARDPFHYVDNGVGLEPVAVICCELGDLFFRGARELPTEVTMPWSEFVGIGERLAALKQVDADDAWQELLDKDDRTSPEEFPEMCLITLDELRGFMSSSYSKEGRYDARSEHARAALTPDKG